MTSAVRPPQQRSPGAFVGQVHFQRRDDVIALVPRPLGRILDVGCGPGLTGAALLDLGATEVWGIERDEALVAEAAQRLTKVVNVDLDRDPCGPLPTSYFDTLLYADILEHLIDPWRVLRAQTALLAQTGSIVVSIPNVRHLRVVLPLLIKGRWEYQDEGLLSRGHLRFFTTASMRSMIEDAGYRIELQTGTYAPVGRWLKWLSLHTLDDLVVRQRLFRATRALRTRQ